MQSGFLCVFFGRFWFGLHYMKVFLFMLGLILNLLFNYGCIILNLLFNYGCIIWYKCYCYCRRYMLLRVVLWYILQQRMNAWKFNLVPVPCTANYLNSHLTRNSCILSARLTRLLESVLCFRSAPNILFNQNDEICTGHGKLIYTRVRGKQQKHNEIFREMPGKLMSWGIS